MKKITKNDFFYFFLLSFLFLLLFYSVPCISLSLQGLLFWFEQMIPSLFPFMILSGWISGSGFSYLLGQWLSKCLFMFSLHPYLVYGSVMGFLCGFPMGAKVTADLFASKCISKEQAAYLLSFTNNLGPIYVLSIALPLTKETNLLPFFLLFYTVPLMYGGILSYVLPKKNKDIFPNDIIGKTIPWRKRASYTEIFRHTLEQSVEQITMLGGTVILFNCLLIYPKLLIKFLYYIFPEAKLLAWEGILYGLVEIGSGISFLADSNLALPQIILPLMTLGGLCSIVQTWVIISPFGLSLFSYIIHKFLQSMIMIILLAIFY